MSAFIFGASYFHCRNEGVERVVGGTPWGACLAERAGACLEARALERAWGGVGLGTSFGVTMLVCQLTDVCDAPPVGTCTLCLCMCDGCIGGVGGGCGGELLWWRVIVVVRDVVEM